jgi:hypothetical protein
MKDIGFKSNNDNTIKLIKINDNTIKLIKINDNKPNELTYKFQLETKEPNEEYIYKKNNSTYSTQFLYKKIQ